MQVVGLGVGSRVQPVVVGQSVRMGIVLADHQVRQVLFGDELDQLLIEPVVVPVQGDVLPLQVHGDQGLDLFVVLLVVGQPPDLLVHVDGPGHKMPLVPPVRQHMVADQQPGDDGIQVELLVRVVFLQVLQVREEVSRLPVRQGLHPGMEQASEDQKVRRKEGSLLAGHDAGEPGFESRNLGRFVVPVHDLIRGCGETDAPQSAQFFGEIPAGRPVVQGQKGPVFRRRYLSGRKNSPSGCQSMIQYTCGHGCSGKSQKGFLQLHEGCSFHSIIIYYNVRKRFCVCESLRERPGD